MTTIERWTVGRKTLAVGDLVRIDTGQARYRITALRQTPTGVEVDAYGGKRGHLGSRVFTVDQVTKVRDQKKNSNDAWLAALHEASAKSKNRKAGTR